MNSTLEKPELLNTTEAADYIGLSPGTLEVWRCNKRRIIPFIKVGRLVRYRKEALDNFLNQQTKDNDNQGIDIKAYVNGATMTE